ncbi:MAG TPA: efflux RND transporter periplasmic adaptor subunit [Candidatus Acidoferrales bacterium]|nr:efflux RND transporter periplasmic adaptor subunit [Candidatus Acidoferrales bacterium]
MKVSRFFFVLIFLFFVALVIYLVTTPSMKEAQFTGIITGNDIIAGPLVSGRIMHLYVDEGSEVKQGQLIAEIDPTELQAVRDAAAANIRTLQARLSQSGKTRTMDDAQTSAGVQQAQAAVTAARAQLEQARANESLDQITYKRDQSLLDAGVIAPQERDTAYSAWLAAQANTKAVADQVKAQEGQLAVAQANRQQVSVQESDVAATQAELAQAVAQKNQTETQLSYTKVYAPATGIVSVRVAREGEVVQAGGPIVTVLDIDNLWIQTDIEENYIDKISFGQKVKVRLPSGEEKEGTVFFKGVENEYATQRDVSRTKRDIKSFTVKVRITNPGRRLFAGMTAYILLPPSSSDRRWFHW